MYTRSDPVSLFIWVAGFGLALLVVRSYSAGGALVGMTFLLYLLDTELSNKRLLKNLPLILIIPTLAGFFNLYANQDGTTVGEIWKLQITQQGLEAALTVSFRLLFVVLSSFIFIWSSNLYALFTGLSSLGLPPRLSLAVYLAMRYVSVLTNDREAILDAIAVRKQGRNVAANTQVWLWLRYLLLLVVSSVRRAKLTAIAVLSRGYESDQNRSFFMSWKLSMAGIALNVLSFVIYISSLLYQL